MAYKRISPQPIVEGGTAAQSFTAYAPVCGGTTTTGALQVADTGLSTSGYVLTSNGNAALPSFQATAGGIPTIGTSTNLAIATWSGTGGNALLNNSTTSITAGGIYTNTALPAFLAIDTSSQTIPINANTTVIFDAEIFDNGNNYDNTTGTFTAPVTGTYCFSAAVTLTSVSVLSTLIQMGFATPSNQGYLVQFSPSGVSLSNGSWTFTSSIIQHLSASQTCTVFFGTSNNGTNMTVQPPGGANNFSWFSGSLIA